MSNNQYLNVAQAASFKGVTVQAIRDVLRNPERKAAIFPGAYYTGTKQRGEWHIPEDEIHAWQPKSYPREAQHE